MPEETTLESLQREQVTPMVPEISSRWRPKKLGRLALLRNRQLDREGAPLPAGYQYADSGTIKTKELVNLLRRVEIGKSFSETELKGIRREERTQGHQIWEVGVRDEAGKLVGFGTLTYSERHHLKDGGRHTEKLGKLGDFVVDPGHQHQGIGKAIISTRVAIAEELGVTSLIIPELEPTNTLHDYYVELGFKETEQGLERTLDFKE